MSKTQLAKMVELGELLSLLPDIVPDILSGKATLETTVINLTKNDKNLPKSEKYIPVFF